MLPSSIEPQPCRGCSKFGLMPHVVNGTLQFARGGQVHIRDIMALRDADGPCAERRNNQNHHESFRKWDQREASNFY